MFRKTSALPMLFVAVLGGIAAIYAVSMNAANELRAFLEQENASMQRSATHAAGYIEEFVARRKQIVEAFAQEHAN